MNRPATVVTLAASATARLMVLAVAASWRLYQGDALTYRPDPLAAVAVLAVGLLRRADESRAAQAVLRSRHDERRDLARVLDYRVSHAPGRWPDGVSAATAE